MLSRFAIAIAIALTISAPSHARPEDEVAAVTREWAKAFAEHNVERVGAFYSKDAIVWGTNAPSLRTTRDELRSFFKAL